MATTEGQANNFDEPSAQKQFTYILSALKIKRKIFESSEFGLALNTFDRKHIWSKLGRLG